MEGTHPQYTPTWRVPTHSTRPHGGYPPTVHARMKGTHPQYPPMPHRRLPPLTWRPHAQYEGATQATVCGLPSCKLTDVPPVPHEAVGADTAVGEPESLFRVNTPHMVLERRGWEDPVQSSSPTTAIYIHTSLPPAPSSPSASSVSLHGPLPPLAPFHFIHSSRAIAHPPSSLPLLLPLSSSSS